MQTKEPSFISKLISSIKDFEKYPEMAAKPFNTVLKYLLILIAIFTLIVSIVSVYNISKNLKNGIEYFKDEIPNVSYIDNKLNVESEEVIKIKNENNIVDLIIINTNDITEDEVNKYTRELEGYTSGVILLRDKLIINMGNGTINYSYEKLSEIYNIGNMTKQDMLEFFEGSNLVMLYIGIFIMTYIYLFMAYLISTLFDAVILSIIGYITCLLLRLRVKFIAMFKISIYALTLPIILNLLYIIIQTLFAFEIKYFEIMYIAVAYIYIVAAILMIKSDILKKQQELTKIIEEQEKVKQQLEREKEEQKQKEEEEKRKKEDEKQRQKKEKKENKDGDELGGEPQRGNA